MILVCIYGIIGLPKSKDELIANWKKNIHLGLDLSGGTQLVMQVQLPGCLQGVRRHHHRPHEGRAEERQYRFQRIDRNDPQTVEDADKIEIDVKGVPVTKSGAFRGIVNDRFSEWILTALNSTDYRLTMKPTEALKLKHGHHDPDHGHHRAQDQRLGLTESSVQPTGRSDAEAELLVQLPGVDDPAHVKQLLADAGGTRMGRGQGRAVQLAGRSARQARRRAAA